MSARRQPLVRIPGPLARRAALLLALAAAFLPSLIPGLHAGHGLPIVVVQHDAASDCEYAGHVHAHHHHHHHHVVDQRSDRSDKAPAPLSKHPEPGACPICRTLQQLAASTVPDSAVIAAPVAIAVTHTPPPAEAPVLPPSVRTPQPRAPPVA